jgi:hypothetical protein
VARTGHSTPPTGAAQSRTDALTPPTGSFAIVRHGTTNGVDGKGLN